MKKTILSVLALMISSAVFAQPVMTYEQAEAYANLSVEYYKAQFGDNNEWKVAVSEDTVVVSNIKKVFRVVKADFN